MNQIQLLSNLLTTLALSGGLSADTLQCFNGAIDSAEVEPPDREEVERRCGSPEQRDGDVWIYQKSQSVYRLSFDSEGKLYLIQREHQN